VVSVSLAVRELVEVESPARWAEAVVSTLLFLWP
jgi:hypothetical protein